MGALIMFTLVIVIANVGGFYFYFHDKKYVLFAHYKTVACPNRLCKEFEQGL